MGVTVDSSGYVTGWSNEATGGGLPSVVLGDASIQIRAYDGVVWVASEPKLGLSFQRTLSPPWTMYMLVCVQSRTTANIGSPRYLYYKDASSYASFTLETGALVAVQGADASALTLTPHTWQRVRISHNGTLGFVEVEDSVAEIDTGSGEISGVMSLFCLSYAAGTRGGHLWVDSVRIIPGDVWADEHETIWAAMATRASELSFWESTLITGDGEHNGFPGYCILASGAELLAYRVGSGHGSYDGVCVVHKRASSSAEWGAATTVHDPGAGYDGRDPSVRQLASGRVLYVCHTRDESIEEVIGAKCYYSDDDGDTWTGPVDVPDPWDGSGKPEAPPVEVGGNVLLPIGRGNSTQHIGVAVSADEGETWDVDDFVVVAEGWTGVDLAEPNLVVMGDGEYCMIARANDRNARLYTSSDGATWTARGIIFDDCYSRCTLVVLGDDRLLAIYRASTFANLVYRISSDNGRTWTDPVSIKPHSTDNEYCAAFRRSDGMICCAAGFLVFGGADIHYFERDEDDL